MVGLLTLGESLEVDDTKGDFYYVEVRCSFLRCQSVQFFMIDTDYVSHG